LRACDEIKVPESVHFRYSRQSWWNVK
jgi:hypothetical protein